MFDFDGKTLKLKSFTRQRCEFFPSVQDQTQFLQNWVHCLHTIGCDDSKTWTTATSLWWCHLRVEKWCHLLGSCLGHQTHFQKTHRHAGKAKGMVRTLYCLLKRNNTVSKHSKISVYRSIIRPIMTYASPIFNNCANSHFNRLQVQQNTCLRSALSVPWDTRITKLHAGAGIPTIREFVDKMNFSFYARARAHDNELTNSLGPYTLDEVGHVKHRLPLDISY